MVDIKMVYVLNSGVIDSVSYAAVVTEHRVLSVYEFGSSFQNFISRGCRMLILHSVGDKLMLF